MAMDLTRVGSGSSGLLAAATAAAHGSRVTQKQHQHVHQERKNLL